MSVDPQDEKRELDVCVGHCKCPLCVAIDAEHAASLSPRAEERTENAIQGLPGSPDIPDSTCPPSTSGACDTCWRLQEKISLNERDAIARLREIGMSARRALSFGRQATPQTPERMIERRDEALRQIVAFCEQGGATSSILRESGEPAEGLFRREVQDKLDVATHCGMRPKEPLPDSVLLNFWQSVQGPGAQLNGPLIRFAGLVQGARAECQQPPDGWSCSRGAGHPGPCAASPRSGGKSVD